MKRIVLFFVVIFIFSMAVHAQTITITLSGDETGWLNCPEANVSTRCWFKSTTPIKSTGMYTGQVSYMSSKSRDGIIIYGNGLSASRGIFIHKGNSVAWSDNCVVIEESQMDKLYSYLKRVYGYNGKELSIYVTRN